MSETRRLSRRCLCGAATYSVDDAFTYAFNCHCADCQRATGSAFKPVAGIPRAQLTPTADAAFRPYGNSPDACDMHCATCGSLLWSVVREGGWVHVAMGTLADAPTIRPAAHIFVRSKAPWFTITDDLPQHDTWG
ncbi:MAG: GFA family protein [Limimaricola sp.]|uniref:GFA family protein n=1 Tax=Limimaricola sp. TaxID=2211665 RepID=UPI001D294E25|nr:GFA family protein [Limimaricola sp.]MBI1416384.1 GFA family protein [Limimaricola sp.]